MRTALRRGLRGWCRHRRPRESLASRRHSSQARSHHHWVAFSTVYGKRRPARASEIETVVYLSAAMMPAIFFGHGNPMNAIERNAYTEAWAKIGKTIPKPKAIVAISAHWYLPATLVTAMEKPRTIHDFGGFPRALYEVSYPAPGDPALARRLQFELDDDWGLDHGTWSVLKHVYPQADVPVLQVSIDETQPASFH